MKRGLAAVATLLLAGCASSNAFRAGETAERREDWDAAILQYSKAVQLKPDHMGYRKSLERAKLRACTEHLNSARRLANRALYKEALDEYTLALNLNPSAAPGVTEEIQTLEARQRAAGSQQGLDALKERSRERALPGLVLGPEAQEPLGLSFRNASLREAYLALGKYAGINFVFDPQFQDQPVTVDLKDVGVEQALTALAGVGHTFHRVLDVHVVMVVADSPQKRREYEQQVVKTFFLSNADLKETLDLLRSVLGARRVAPLPGANALTISDTPEKVLAAERIVDAIDKKRAEVVVDVELLEVNRTRLKEYGIEITSNVAGTAGIVGGIFPNPLNTSAEQNPYSKSNLVVTGLPGVIYRLLQSDSGTRLLANPQLRSSEGQTAQARFGDQVPVPVTVFTPIAQGGVAQQPVTSFEYKNVGVNIDITPRVHHDGEVTLTLKLDISAQGAAGYQGLPTFTSRQVTSVIRLHDGETNLLAGLINDAERTSMSGLPGLSSLPILGKLFAHNHEEVDETDIVMTLTPHIVRRPELTEEDLRSFALGTESSPLLFDVSGAPPAFTPPVTPRPAESPRIEPIRPPAPAPAPSPSPGQP